MRVEPYVLYLDLLEDLSTKLPRSVYDDLVHQRDVEVWPDITPTQHACLSLAKSFLKKFKDETEPEADERALRKFLSANERCGTWVYSPVSAHEEELFGSFKKHLHRFFYPSADHALISSFSQILSEGRNGSGASLGSVGTDSYTKLFSSKLTSTSEALYRAYRIYIDQFPDWSNAEVIRSATYGSENVVPGCRLGFVPKQRTISRVTCTEPTLNMFYQLGIGSLIEKRLNQYFRIDIRDQAERNKELARSGSRTGRFSTIDLESASDSVSMVMLRAVLPANALSWLELTRSKTVTLPNGEQASLNMVSTMGNGFTFPLQTAIFGCIVAAAFDSTQLRAEFNRGGQTGNFGVFGDDIIIPTELWGDVNRLLRLLGFTVNTAKSFNEGTFRESCGGDFFEGNLIRGVYVKTLRTIQDRVVVLNRLHQWTAVTGIYLVRTCKRLYHSIPKQFVPFRENDDAGLKVPFSLVDRMRQDRHTQSIKYRRWESVPRRILAEDEGSLHRNRRIWNPSGLHLSFLSGHIRSGCITSRQEVVRYRTKSSVAPSWDPPRRLLMTDMSWQRFEAAVWLTIG